MVWQGCVVCGIKFQVSRSINIKIALKEEKNIK